MPDFDKAAWQDMQEVPADKFDGVQRHLLNLVSILRISPAEAYAPVFQA
jgi:hypothetical protein